MTDLSEIIKPFDLSLFEPNNFRVIVTRMPETLFYIQSCVIPGITINPVTTRYTGYNLVPYPGETMEVDDVALNFIVNENLDNYMEMHRWIREAISQSEPQLHNRFFSNIILFTLTNNKNANIVMTFKDAFPFSLSAINLDLTGDAAGPIISTVTFKFAKMIIDPDLELSSHEPIPSLGRR